MNNITEMNHILESLGAVWVRISEYRMTHGYMHLLITDAAFTKLADMYFTDCFLICGPTSGGPWRLNLSTGKEGGDPIVILSAGEGAFVVKALRVQASRA